MSEQKQTIVQPAAPPNKAFGARNQSNLQSMFANSPVYNGDMSDEERTKLYQELALDGTVSGGHGINSFSRDFDGAPDITQVETGGGGKPASPYVPNLTSPGPGSISAADQPEFTGTLPDGVNRSNFGSGLGGTASPEESSKSISEQTLLGTYISGKSYLGSDGQS